jgi:hypothetical protein
MQFFLGLFCSSNQRMLLILELKNLYGQLHMDKKEKGKKNVLFT